MQLWALFFLCHLPDNEEIRQMLIGMGGGADAQQLMHGDRVWVARAHVPCRDVDAESGNDL